jgi:hypothetical protein
MHSYFLRAVGGHLCALAERPTLRDLSRAVDGLIQLFQALALPPENSVRGLWAELFLIAHAVDVPTVIKAWQTKKRSLFDFTCGTHVLEVKSTCSGLRQHRFRLDQLLPRAGQFEVVVSILLTQSGDGVSIVDLWDRLAMVLKGNNENVRRLSEIIARAIGSDWRRCTEAKYDEGKALESMRLYDPRRIPKVGCDAPPEITDIEFTVDLTDCPALTSAEVCAHGGLFSSFWGNSGFADG